jgi:pimeloyl-ACP methyl ester carboxylesterase
VWLIRLRLKGARSMSRAYYVLIRLLATLFVAACQPIQAPTPDAAPAEAASSTPRFEPAACRYEMAENEQVECGYLIVPEDRSQPDGRTIRVYVMNLKAKAAQPKADPVIFVSGGPSAPTAAALWMMTATPLGEALRGERDVLHIEYRGSNMSEPAFYCPEMDADLAELSGLSLAEEMEQAQAAYRACHDRLLQEGYDLSIYGSVDIAADIADLRVALGYEEVNVVGISWGTVVLFYLLRDHPEGIRSAVLDGVWPPEVFQGAEYLRMTQKWLDALFQACAEDTVCEAAYPELKTVFYESLRTLRNAPVSVTVEDDSGLSHEVLVDDLKYANYVLTIGFLGDGFTAIPAAVMTAQNGDYAAIAQGWLGFLAGRHSENAPGSGATALGAALTAWCQQEYTTGSLALAGAEQAKVESVPSLQEWATLIVQDWLLPCEYWNASPKPSSAVGEAIASDVPTLMLVSRLDAATAPYFSDAAIERFSRGHRIELRASHVSTLTPCGAELMAQFIDDPSQAPDANCIEETKPNWVLSE